jgi:hypothetical protein
MTTAGKPILVPLSPKDRKRLEKACEGSKRNLGRQGEYYILQGLEKDGL